MRLSTVSSPVALLATGLSLLSSASAMNYITSSSLNPCQGLNATGFTATLFQVTLFPDNYTLYYDIKSVSAISGNVIANIQAIAYGFSVYNQTIDPCKSEALKSSLCPLNAGTIPELSSDSVLSPKIVNTIPSIAYAVPDLDGLVRVHITRDTGEVLACVEASLSNGKTVDQTGVKWATAAIAGLALVVSAVTSGLGHSNTAAHVAANALSLFGFFQAQAMIGMCSARMPPIVESWTQNFQWSMGIVSINFMQSILTWYQRATGGNPSTILSDLSITSVQVQKRAVEAVDLVRRSAMKGFELFYSRDGTDNTAETEDSTTSVIVKGITRVGFRAGIEPTNIFITGLAFFVAFVIAVSICVALFKAGCEGAAKAGWIKGDKFQDFRNGWRIVLKGILFRLVLIGYAQMSILCLWEMTTRDSPAEVVSALFYFIAMTVALVWAAFKVTRLAKRSVAMHKNPAYILYSDPTALNKWGFLYVQFRATAYYFILPVLCHLLLKAIFIAFSQNNPVAQAVGLLIIEALWLIGVSILRPWMDKKTNAFNIAIAAMNFFNAILLLFFTNVFNQPALATGILGVVFALFNVIFAAVLLIMVLIASIYAIVSKDPDTRYQPMRDDRGSFIKSATNLTTELDALGATARGDMKMRRDLDDDSDSFTTGSFQRDAAGVPLPASAATSSRHVDQYGAPRSPIDPSTPFIPSDGGARHGQPAPYSDYPNRNMYSGGAYNDGQPGYNRSNTGSPAPRYGYSDNNYARSGSLQSGTSYRPQAPTGGGGQWQRGAGYDH